MFTQIEEIDLIGTATEFVPRFKKLVTINTDKIITMEEASHARVQIVMQNGRNIFTTQTCLKHIITIHNSKS